MGQKNSSNKKARIYYEYTHGIAEEIKTQLSQQEFVFQPESYCCYLKRKGLTPRMKFCKHYMGSMYNLRYCADFDSLIEHLQSFGRLCSDKYKYKEKERNDILLPRIKTLASLGFVPDTDYSNYRYEELLREIDIAKKKQQEYFDNVSRIGKYIREKEAREVQKAQELQQEEGSAAVKN